MPYPLEYFVTDRLSVLFSHFNSINPRVHLIELAPSVAYERILLNHLLIITPNCHDILIEDTSSQSSRITFTIY